jgi:uncharacterized protein
MLVPAEVWTVAKADQGSAVLIKPVGSDIAVPIFIGPLEAQSILIGLASHKMPRPLTHDLFIDTLDQLGSRIVRIEITELKEGTFFARLLLNQQGNDYSIDSRPSDCIALAVRTKCPIYIDEGVVDEAGISITSVKGQVEMNETEEDREKEARLDELQKQLEKAVEQENYEEAAILRDKIRQMEQNG